jgi:demethylmenaquinone methyltransferase/2-methoxy-6-polyprenyl-1,4-benzoquinol methylase
MSRDEVSKTREFYDRISKVYDHLADASEHTAREKGLELLGVRGGESVLEIGFGTGRSLVELARRVGASGLVSGVDISEGMQEQATRTVEEAGCAGNVNLRVAAVPPLPFPDDAFDAAFMSFTLELFPMDVIPEILGEVRRVLKPRGRLGVVAMNVVAEGESESLLERTYKWMHQHFPHIVDCQPIPTARLLEASDFHVQREEHLDIWTMPVRAAVATAGR